MVFASFVAGCDLLQIVNAVLVITIAPVLATFD